jgi:hypothetical protein
LHLPAPLTRDPSATAAKDRPTQVGRALAQLGIEHIPAHEGAFGSLQDRLPKELQLAGITTVEAAKRFLREL